MTHFGPFHNQQLELQPGINIIYGENEAGKTTLHQFIQAMLFGVERLRGKAAERMIIPGFSHGNREKIMKARW